MNTEKVRPQQGVAEHQGVQRREVSRTIEFGRLSMAAIAGAIAVLIALVAVGVGEQSTPPAAVSVAEGAARGPGSPGPEPANDPFAVASRWAVVAWTDDGDLNPVDAVRDLPPQVKDLLGRAKRIAGPGSEVATDGARAVAEILGHSGFAQTSFDDQSLGVIAYAGHAIVGIDIARRYVALVIEFHPILPASRLFPLRG